MKQATKQAIEAVQQVARMTERHGFARLRDATTSAGARS